jgi:anti-anti-sigma factor
MDAPALTIKTVRDGPVCTLILRDELDFLASAGFLEQAARVVDDRTERLVLDLAELTFLDCAGVRALVTAVSFAPCGCPIIVRGLSHPARRIIELLDLDLENLREFRPPGQDRMHDLDGVHLATSLSEACLVELGDIGLDA